MGKLEGSFRGRRAEETCHVKGEERKVPDGRGDELEARGFFKPETC